MRSTLTLAVVGGMLCGAVGSAAAQQQPAMPHAAVTYFRCSPGDAERADSLWKRSLAAIHDRHVAAGAITAWGWLAHSMGSDWSRAVYVVAPTRDQLLDARAKIIQDMRAASARSPGQTIAAFCPSHDDYIWAVVATAEGAPPAGSARQPTILSTYYQCDQGRSPRADEIFRTVLAPIYDKHMKAGHFTTWGWLRHVFGGSARRLQTLDASDLKTAMSAAEMVFREAAETAPIAFQEFLSICSGHEDYAWRLVMGKP